MEIDFIVSAFGFGTQLTLCHPLQRKRYLSFSSSVVEYTQKPSQWIFERDDANDSVCYIKVDIPSPTFQQYLGCPNSDNSLGLYTTKGRFTRWSIQKIEGDLITVRYKGQKFNRSDVQLVVAASTTDDLRWISSYKDIATVYTGRKGYSFLTYIIQEYSTLKGQLFFLDGDPFRTNNTVLFAIDNYEKLTGIVPLGGGATVTEYGLKYGITQVGRDGSTGVYDKEARIIQTGYREHYRLNNEGLSVVDNFLTRAGLPIAGPTYTYTPGSLLMAPKEAIIQRPVYDYTKLLSAVTNGATNLNELVFERLWFYIIQNKTIIAPRAVTPSIQRSMTPKIQRPVTPNIQRSVTPNIQRSVTPTTQPSTTPITNFVRSYTPKHLASAK